MTDTYGRREANVEHNANGLMWALDNWMYTSEHDSYLRLKDGKFEVRRTLARGQWGVSQDDAGRIYRNTNASALYVDLVPDADFTRNPNLLRTRGSYESLGDEQANVNTLAGAADARRQSRLPGRRRCAPDGTLARSRRCARRPSIAAIGCRRSCTATSSSPSRRAISSAG